MNKQAQPARAKPEREAPSLDSPLSGKQLHEMLKQMDERPNIITDKSINENSTIEDIFNGSGHSILFHNWGGKIGHWYAMVRSRNPPYIYFFDSFGEHPDKYNKHIKDVVLKSGNRFYYNNNKFQNDKASSCGRHALLVCGLNKMNIKPNEIENAFKSLDNPDEFVVNMIRQ